MNPRYYHSENKNIKVLEFEKKETITVGIEEFANDLESNFEDIFCDQWGYSHEDLECIDYDKVKLEVAKLWIAECLEKGLTS